jgi:O-antigen/teichoic acid export membrane protein
VEHKTPPKVTSSRAETSFIASLAARLLSGGAWAFGGKAAAVLLLLISNALLARLLSPQDMGAYFLAYSLVLFGLQVGALGLDKGVVRLVATNIGLNQPKQVRRVVSVAVRLGVLGALGVGFAYLLFGDVLAQDLFNMPALGGVTGLVAVWIAVMSLQTLLAEILRGFYDIRSATLFSGLVGWALLTVCLALLWWFEGPATLSTVMLLAVASNSVGVLLAGWILHHKVRLLPLQGTESRIRVREVLRVSWPMFVAGLTFFVLNQSGLWVTSAFRPPEEVALYGAASRAVTVIPMTLLVASQVVQPFVADLYAQGKKLELERMLRAVATFAGIPALFVAAGFILLGGPILGLVFGSYYQEGATVLALLSIGTFVWVWVGASYLTLLMTRHEILGMAITIASGILTIVVQLLIVDHYGAAGVAAAQCAGIGLQGIAMWLAVRGRIGVWTHAGLVGLSDLLTALSNSIRYVHRYIHDRRRGH